MPVTQYKKVEKDFADRLGAWFRRFWVSLANLFKYIMVKGKQRFTVMLIPHSEKKIFNFQISFFTLFFVTLTLGIVLIGFFLLATNFTYTNEQLTQTTQALKASEATVESLKDEVAGVRQANRSFKASLDNVVSVIQDHQDLAADAGGSISGIASDFLAPPETDTGGLREISDLKSMVSLMQSSVGPLNSIGKLLSTRADFVQRAPTLWPLKGGVGYVTTGFVWTIHPFTHVGYFHTGIDIAWAQGTPVLAAADGKIIESGRDDELGNYIIIQHNYGFTTRYGHMSAFAGKHKGDRVSRGDVIGYVGSTGLSTGPHLHYEVRLGSNYVNPVDFLIVPPDVFQTQLLGNTRSSD